MAAHSGSRIADDGLVFHFDMENSVKSWKGKPTTNLVPDPLFKNAIWNTWAGRGANSWTFGEFEGESVVYTDLSINVGERRQLFRDITVSSSLTTYALSIDVYVTTDCDATQILANQEYPFGRSFGSLSYDLSKKGTWQRIAKRAISDGTVRYIPVYPRRNGVTDGSFTGFFMWGGVQVEDGSHASRLEPADDGVSTRATTESVVDLTNRSTIITQPSLEYASDDYPRFSPSNVNSTINIPLSTALNKQKGTINLWAKADAYASSNGFFVNRDSSTANAADWLWLGVWSSGSILYFRLGNGSACCNNDLTIGNFSTNHMPTNTWTNICVTWESGVASKIYINGNQVASRTISSIPNTNPSSTGRIGLGHASGSTGSWDGEIPIFTIYNDVLTADKIRRNFEGLRDRFGV